MVCGMCSSGHSLKKHNVHSLVPLLFITFSIFFCCSEKNIFFMDTTNLTNGSRLETLYITSVVVFPFYIFFFFCSFLGKCTLHPLFTVINKIRLLFINKSYQSWPVRVLPADSGTRKLRDILWFQNKSPPNINMRQISFIWISINRKRPVIPD